jgi:hypothetical protein
MKYQHASIRNANAQKQCAPTITRDGEYREWSEDIPWWFAPAIARPKNGLFIPSDEVLQVAAYGARSQSLQGWTQGQGSGCCEYQSCTGEASTDLRGESGDVQCRVHRFGRWWAIERFEIEYQVLAYHHIFLGALLVVTPTYEAMIQLAQYCSPRAPHNIGPFSWVEGS